MASQLARQLGPRGALEGIPILHTKTRHTD